jgi:hypothetical protein
MIAASTTSLCRSITLQEMGEKGSDTIEGPLQQLSKHLLTSVLSCDGHDDTIAK